MMECFKCGQKLTDTPMAWVCINRDCVLFYISLWKKGDVEDCQTKIEIYDAERRYYGLE